MIAVWCRVSRPSGQRPQKRVDIERLEVDTEHKRPCHSDSLVTAQPSLVAAFVSILYLYRLGSSELPEQVRLFLCACLPLPCHGDENAMRRCSCT